MENRIILMGNTHFHEHYQNQVLLNLVHCNLQSQICGSADGKSVQKSQIHIFRGNSAVEPDHLISVLLEMSALSGNSLLLVACTIPKADFIWLPSSRSENQNTRLLHQQIMVHHSHGLEWELVSNIYQLKKGQYFLQTQMHKSTLLCSVLCEFSNQLRDLCFVCNVVISHLHKVDLFLKILL